MARITPAYAGKSCALFASTIDWLGSPPPMRGKGSGWRWVITISQDHPRLCGEKRFGNTGNSERLGSPPPMRGKD